MYPISDLVGRQFTILGLPVIYDIISYDDLTLNVIGTVTSSKSKSSNKIEYKVLRSAYDAGVISFIDGRIYDKASVPKPDEAKDESPNYFNFDEL